MPELPTTDFVALAPDWACEMLSAETRTLDLGAKRPVYAREGVAHLWFIDPRDRTLEAFELRDGEWALIACAKDDEPVSIRPFDAITFSLGGSLAVTEIFAVALSGEPKGWLVEAASADDAIDIVHGTVPRARKAGREAPSVRKSLQVGAPLAHETAFAADEPLIVRERGTGCALVEGGGRFWWGNSRTGDRPAPGGRYIRVMSRERAIRTPDEASTPRPRRARRARAGVSLRP